MVAPSTPVGAEGAGGFAGGSTSDRGRRLPGLAARGGSYEAAATQPGVLRLVFSGVAKRGELTAP
jgi:hypothetical protein